MMLKGKRLAVGPVFFTIAMVVVCLLCLQLAPACCCATGCGLRAALSWAGRVRRCPTRLALTLPKAAALRMPPIGAGFWASVG